MKSRSVPLHRKSLEASPVLREPLFVGLPTTGPGNITSGAIRLSTLRLVRKYKSCTGLTKKAMIRILSQGKISYCEINEATVTEHFSKVLEFAEKV